jgi:hypothetical protein
LRAFGAVEFGRPWKVVSWHGLALPTATPGKNSIELR